MTRIWNYRTYVRNSAVKIVINRADTGVDRRTVGKCGIHTKLVNRMGAIQCVERFGGMNDGRKEN